MGEVAGSYVILVTIKFVFSGLMHLMDSNKLYLKWADSFTLILKAIVVYFSRFIMLCDCH